MAGVLSREFTEYRLSVSSGPFLRQRGPNWQVGQFNQGLSLDRRKRDASYPICVRVADIAHRERERDAFEVSKQHGGPVTTSDELRLSINDRYRWNLEIASSSRPVVEPLFQISVSHVLHVPAQKVVLIEMRKESGFRDPPGSVGWQIDVGKTTQKITRH
jgi:hypothetical protein